MHLLEGQHRNLLTAKKIKPFIEKHEEPNQAEIFYARSKINKVLLNFVNNKNEIYFMIGNIFKYRIAKNTALFNNIYELLKIILYEDINFSYSPQYGVSFFPKRLGFQKLPCIVNVLKEKPWLYFSDYISETTTFITFHNEFRYPEIFTREMRIILYINTLHVLLFVAKEMNKFHVMFDILQVAVKMLYIEKCAKC